MYGYIIAQVKAKDNNQSSGIPQPHQRYVPKMFCPRCGCVGLSIEVLAHKLYCSECDLEIKLRRKQAEKLLDTLLFISTLTFPFNVEMQLFCGV